jgi:hypothetical protein
MFKDRAMKLGNIIRVSIMSLIISTSSSFARDDLFKNLASEMLKAVEKELKKEAQKKNLRLQQAFPLRRTLVKWSNKSKRA